MPYFGLEEGKTALEHEILLYCRLSCIWRRKQLKSLCIPQSKFVGSLLHAGTSYHTDYTIKKANGTLYFLAWKFKHCSPDIKLKCYLSLVRPIIEYAFIIWLPYQLTLINKIESVQHRSARFILNNYERYNSVTNMLRQLDLPTLATRRTCNRIIMMFKIFKNVVHIPVEPPIFTFNTLETRGHS